MKNNDEQNWVISLQNEVLSLQNQLADALASYKREHMSHSVTLRALEVVRGEVKDAHRRIRDWETGAKGY